MVETVVVAAAVGEAAFVYDHAGVVFPGLQFRQDFVVACEGQSLRRGRPQAEQQCAGGELARRHDAGADQVLVTHRLAREYQRAGILG